MVSSCCFKTTGESGEWFWMIHENKSQTKVSRSSVGPLALINLLTIGIDH